MNSRWRFISDHHMEYGIQRLCRIFRVSRSGFYRCRQAEPAVDHLPGLRQPSLMPDRTVATDHERLTKGHRQSRGITRRRRRAQYGDASRWALTTEMSRCGNRARRNRQSSKRMSIAPRLSKSANLER
ncbi:hypothetical protein GCM10009612_63380 [Streptomyces beijiangensis]